MAAWCRYRCQHLTQSYWHWQLRYVCCCIALPWSSYNIFIFICISSRITLHCFMSHRICIRIAHIWFCFFFYFCDWLYHTMLECQMHSLHSCMILCLYYTECSTMRRIALLWEGSHRYENYYLLLYLLLKLKLIISRNLFYVDLNITNTVLSTSEPFNTLLFLHHIKRIDTLLCTALLTPYQPFWRYFHFHCKQLCIHCCIQCIFELYQLLCNDLYIDSYERNRLFFL